MIWDMFTAILCIIGFLYLYFKEDVQEDFQVREMIYYFKTAYGLLSFPFLLFAIPFMDFVLTKSRPTGYDK